MKRHTLGITLVLVILTTANPDPHPGTGSRRLGTTTNKRDVKCRQGTSAACLSRQRAGRKSVWQN